MVLVVFFAFNFNFVLAEEFNITSKEVVLYNLNDDKIIYALNKDEKVPVASLTKIMTTLIAVENIEDLDKTVKITNQSFVGTDGYSKAGFSVGDVVTYKDLLYGVMLPSGAEAVNTIVLNVSGDLDSFVALMNNKAQELGLTNTHFDNAVGMDRVEYDLKSSSDFEEFGNYSTAYDMATLLKEALKNETFKEIFTTKKYTVESTGLVLKSTLISYSNNSYVDVSNILGSKSGFTDEAGLCLASISNINEVDYLLVTLGASTNNRANAIIDSTTIYNYYSENYSYRSILKNNQVIKTIPVKLGKIDKYDIKGNKDIQLYLSNDLDLSKIEYKYSGIEELNYQILKGTKLGIVEIYYEDLLLTSFDVYLEEEIEYYIFQIYGIIALIILILFILLCKIRKKKLKRKKRRTRRK